MPPASKPSGLTRHEETALAGGEESQVPSVRVDFLKVSGYTVCKRLHKRVKRWR